MSYVRIAMLSDAREMALIEKDIFDEDKRFITEGYYHFRVENAILEKYLTMLKKKESIFENDSLKKTAEQLEPRFRRKKLHEIKWEQITAIISALKVDIQDLVYIVTELKKAIEEI